MITMISGLSLPTRVVRLSQTSQRWATEETSDGRVCEDGVRGSTHTGEGEREGGSRQQSQEESDKGRIDSRTTAGRRDGCETDVPDKAE